MCVKVSSYHMHGHMHGPNTTFMSGIPATETNVGVNLLCINTVITFNTPAGNTFFFKLEAVIRHILYHRDRLIPLLEIDMSPFYVMRIIPFTTDQALRSVYNLFSLLVLLKIE